jgi:hypothetical protein
MDLVQAEDPPHQPGLGVLGGAIHQLVVIEFEVDDVAELVHGEAGDVVAAIVVQQVLAARGGRIGIPRVSAPAALFEPVPIVVGDRHQSEGVKPVALGERLAQGLRVKCRFDGGQLRHGQVPVGLQGSLLFSGAFAHGVGRGKGARLVIRCHR